jgi:hypothetical protein
MWQTDIAEAGHGDRDPAALARPLVGVERADRCQLVKAGPLARGQDDRVDGFAGAVAPADAVGVAVAVEVVEHRSSVRVAERIAAR